jgi:hypothetical protein
MDIEQALAQVAEQYRCEGYRVILHPGGGDVPPFAEGQEVDLVAYRDEEKVLVQVKVSREDLRDDAGAIRMAELVNSQPGWRFDLIVLNPNGSAYQVSPDASEPPLERIEQNLASAEQMSNTGELQLAFVISWAALEAAMRYAARGSGIEVKSAAPSFLLRALYSEGLLHRNEFDQLNEALKVRNALVHGMMIPAVNPSVPRYVVGVARRLLSENGKSRPA